MKSIQARLLAAALAVMIGSVLAKSQPAADAPPPPPMHEHEFGFGDGHMMGFFADYLNLSDAQQAQMKSIMEKEHPAIKPLMQQMHATRQQLHQYEEGAYDEAKVRALAGQQAQTMVELTVAQTRIHNEMFQVLTTDQQSKMKEFEARREARMQKHMQGHRNGDAPPAPPEQ